MNDLQGKHGNLTHAHKRRGRIYIHLLVRETKNKRMKKINLEKEREENRQLKKRGDE